MKLVEHTVIHHIQSTCRISSSLDIPTVIYEDNVVCIAQFIEGYIKGDKSKHISPNSSTLMSSNRTRILI